jgi:hypothetical protein
MKTKVSNKNEKRFFETLNNVEMTKILGGGDKFKTKTVKDKDVVDPDEH